MRNGIAHCVAVALPLALVLFAAVLQETQCQDATTIAKSAATALGPIISDYRYELRKRRETQKVEIRGWMHKGDAQLNGCGYQIQVYGSAGGQEIAYFPQEALHKCGEDYYQMRITSQTAVYNKEIPLANQQAVKIELFADGWHNTYANVLCIGLNEPTIADGPRAFCINSDFLRGCKGLVNQWTDIYLEWNDVMVTRSVRGAEKIVFSDLENLVNSMELFSQDPDDLDAIRSACNRIALVRGTGKEEHWECSARKTWNETRADGTVITRYKDEYKNPYGCERYTYSW